MATWIAATGMAARVSLTVLSPLPTLLPTDLGQR